MSDIDYLLTGDPEERITWKGHFAWGEEVKGSRRSIAHLEKTNQAAIKAFGTGISVLQSAYNVGFAPSAGTHDKDAVYDVEIPGVDFWTQQRFFRRHGWAAWYRFPAQGFSNHIHMVSLGYTTEVGVFVPAQVDDYYRHALGLAGRHDSGSDPTWHPDDIDATIFDYSAWKAGLEDDMPYTEKELTGIIRAANEPLLDRIVGLEVMLNEAAKRDRRIAANLRAILKQEFGATDEQLDRIEAKL